VSLMPSSKKPIGFYYYASGHSVDLTLDETWLAIDTRQFKAAGTSARLQAALLKGAQPVRGDLILVKRQALTPKQLDALTRLGAAHPVFQSKGALLIALPEVRVEESSNQRRRALLRWIREHADNVEIVEENGEKIVLRPTSGQGSDAITLANQLNEQIGPELAQPRFLRVVAHFGAVL
jgi:hypothetical protein